MDDHTGIEIEIQRLRRDIRDAAALLTPSEARYLVDLYYTIQDQRIRSAGQIRSGDEEPNALLAWMLDGQKKLENAIRLSMDTYSSHHVVGRWSKSIYGIGPVLAAGLLAHIDIKQAPTVGHIWSFAGLNPTSVWEKKKKRPWNARLKVLCWKIGESFVKVRNREQDVYGKVYWERKALEIERNVTGELAEQAAGMLSRKKFRQETDAFAWYSGCYTLKQGRAYFDAILAGETPVKLERSEVNSGQAMLPPAHINARARRYAVKLFLAHWHHVAFHDAFGGAPPMPYVIEHGGHTHFVAPPNWPLE